MSGADAQAAPAGGRARTARWIAPAAVVVWLFAALFAPLIAPYDPAAIQEAGVFEGISRAHWLGTDYFGRDLLSRIIAGARQTVGIALAATALAASLGLALALAAAASGGWLDQALSRFLDAMISIPSKMSGLVVVTVFGSSITVLILTLAFIYVPGCYRINRASAVNVAALDYVTVARARGEGLFHIMFREILPNMTGPALADSGLRFIYVVLLLSSLSFLGLGVQPPQADWGSLARENMGGLPYGAPAAIMPALAIATLTVSVNLMIDAFTGSGAREGGAR